MSVSTVPNEESNKQLVVCIIPSQIYEQNNLNFDPSILKLQAVVHIVNRIIFTNQNVAGLIEL